MRIQVFTSMQLHASGQLLVSILVPLTRSSPAGHAHLRITVSVR